MWLFEAQAKEPREEEGSRWCCWRLWRTLTELLGSRVQDRSDMKVTLLGKSQKAVLYADVSHPELTDAELSRLVGISPGRISTIRSQLVRDGIYREIKIPSLDLLGFEGVGFIIIQPKDPHISEDEKKRQLIDSVGKHPNVIYSAETGGSIVLITAFPRLSMLEAFSDEVFEVCCKLGESDCRIISESFPLDISKIHSLWDFSSLLHDKFELHMPPPQKSYSYGRRLPHQQIDLDDLRMLDLMIRFPVANDVDLAKSAGVSLSTFRRMKEKIMDIGLCRRAFVPEISKLGFELCVFSLLKLNPCRSLIGEIDHIRGLVSPWPFLMFTRKSMAFVGHCFTDYTSYARFSSHVLSELKKKMIHLDVIETVAGSTVSMRQIKPLNFSGILSPLISTQ
jgi:hypothetical protein